MPYVVNLLSCYFIDVGESCWQIKLSHLIKAEVPELFALLQVFIDKGAAVEVTSNVTNPNIIAFVSEEEGRSQMLLIYNPGVR